MNTEFVNEPSLLPRLRLHMQFTVITTCPDDSGETTIEHQHVEAETRHGAANTACLNHVRANDRLSLMDAAVVGVFEGHITPVQWTSTISTDARTDPINDLLMKIRL